jgi:hypothetical protein
MGLGRTKSTEFFGAEGSGQLCLAPVLFLAAFVVIVAGSWAWFNALPRDDSQLPWFTTTTNVAGYQFETQPLSPTALEILRSPEYINGRFQARSAAGREPSSSQAISIFSANWSAASGEVMTVVQHTPDVCWVGSGWQPLDLGQPKQVALSIPHGTSPAALKGKALPSTSFTFECRAFLAPEGQVRELVLWCTLVGGRILPESARFRLSKEKAAMADVSNGKEKQLAIGRRLTIDYFVHAVTQRLRARGTKQFIRLSTSVSGNPEDALAELAGFARQCLFVQYQSERRAARP